MDKHDVLKLSELAHIHTGDKEAEKLLPDLDAILRYVSEIQEVSGTDEPEKKAGIHHNIMRGDDSPHESGVYSEALLNEAPEREGDYVKVKKIL